MFDLKTMFALLREFGYADMRRVGKAPPERRDQVIALLRTRRAIASAAPEQFDMSFYMRADSLEEFKTIHSCQTAACIAGWACFANAPEANVYSPLLPGYETPRSKGQAILGLDRLEANRLFEPVSFNDYDHIKQADALRVIDHLIDTGEVDWTITDAYKAENG